MQNVSLQRSSVSGIAAGHGPWTCPWPSDIAAPDEEADLSHESRADLLQSLAA